LKLDPGLVLEETPDGWTGVALQGTGGACGLLADRRCRLHADRPTPCRLFPIHVHFGDSVQATLVLSCPGVDLTILAAGAGFDPPSAPPGVLQEERRTLMEFRRSVEFRSVLEWAVEDHEILRSRYRGRSHPSEETDRRAQWVRSPPMPSKEDFPAAVGPSEEDGLELLPIFHHATHGIVGLSESGGQVDLLALSPRGGVADRLGTYALPDRPPRLEGDGGRLLRGYLGLLARRDSFADGVRFEWAEERGRSDLFGLFEESLRGAAATVLTRSTLRAMLDGRPGGVLDAEDVAAGIRATDAEILDRPVIGRNL
jgi:hypothetical protein